MRQILFSCLGTTDPVRGEHDGPMLHILRWYRPECAVLFLSQEIQELDAKDRRFEKTRTWINDNWGDYKPEFRYIECDVRDAHDMDALEKPLYDAVLSLSRENQDAEILINLSSGTPQMQMILSQLALDMRFRTKGVQVSTFEKRAGKAQRTNNDEYDVDLELECNEDELPEAENRCIEPDMFAVRKEFLRRQIIALLDERNFGAVEQLKDSLPEKLRLLVMHLAARSRLHGNDAKRLAGEIKDLPFKLYSYKTGSRGEYNEVSEYYLLMKNLLKTGECTEFLLHMEPLTLTLQLALLDKLLQGTGCQTGDFISRDRRRAYFEPDRLRTVFPDLYRHYKRQLAARGWAVERKEINTYICDDLLCYFNNVPEKAARLFHHYEMLKDLRNQLAHALCTVTEADIRAACQTDPLKLLEEMEATIIACYPACDPVIFSVYEKSMEYIKENL